MWNFYWLQFISKDNERTFHTTLCQMLRTLALLKPGFYGKNTYWQKLNPAFGQFWAVWNLAPLTYLNKNLQRQSQKVTIKPSFLYIKSTIIKLYPTFIFLLQLFRCKFLDQIGRNLSLITYAHAICRDKIFFVPDKINFVQDKNILSQTKIYCPRQKAFCPGQNILSKAKYTRSSGSDFFGS